MSVALELNATIAATLPVESGASYPLSPLQQGMLFHSLYAQQSGVDIEQMLFTIRAELNAMAFREAWQYVIARHAILRTRFQWEGLDEPLQQACAFARLQLEEEDWQGLSASKQQAQLADYLQRDRLRGFDLTQESLMRVALFQIGERDYHFIWTFHHALIDGRSSVLVLREVYSVYQSLSRGEVPQLEPTRSYRDYIEWLKGFDACKAEAFWRESLKGFTAPTSLPATHNLKHAADIARRHDEQELRLTPGLTSALKSLASQCGVTLYTLVQAAWALLLSRYSGEPDVVFGATRACRRSALEGAESMIGLFINTLPVRISVPADQPLRAFLQEIRAQHLALRAYEHTPLQAVRQWCEVPGGSPLFESVLVFENYDLAATLQLHWRDWQICDFHLLEQTNYPLALSGWSGEALELNIEYDPRRFDEAAISRMLGHLKTLLESMLSGVEQTVSTLPMLTEAERHQLLVEWNATRENHPASACVQQRFEAQAARTPNALAVMFGDERLSYRELNARANQLAHHLSSLGVGPDVLVAISVERSIEMIVGLFGILKAGGAYVPLDPAYPKARLAAMLEDARPPVLLTVRRLLAGLPQTEARVICLDADWEIIAQGSRENPSSKTTPDNLAYVIYTSGSTGKPKGVMIEHRSLANYVEAASANFSIDPADRVLQFASISFDTSAEEIYPCLARGARLALRTDSMLNSSSAFLQQCSDWNITVLDLPTAYWHELTASLDGEGLSLPSSIRLVIIGGERALPERVATWRARVNRGVRLLNTYGPTEATIVATSADLSEATASEAGADVLVGRPMPNLQTYILDQHLEPVALGVPGELHIGGAGLARGYLNRSELTAAKFIPDPFSNESGARLYKTGDLARYLPSGEIQLAGRIDDQVKLNGFRIELGEIEAALRSHAEVRDTVVLAMEDRPGEKRLVAYVVPHQSRDQSTQAGIKDRLRSFLRTRLPGYMLPAAFMQLDALPLSASGKVNRKALPSPDRAQITPDDKYVRPRDPLEKQLVEIWEEILNVQPIGIRDSFFELGGHSLLSVRLMDRIEREFGKKLPLATLFEEATVEHLAAELLRQEAATAQSAIVEVQKGGSKRPFFFLHGDFNGGGFYCLNLARGLCGEQPFYAIQPHGLDGGAIPATIEAMAACHLQALRAFQPAGPYLLGGYCNGGLIAFEMARQLQSQGEQVDLLVLLCASASNIRYKRLLSLVSRMGRVKGLEADAQLRQFLALRARVVRMRGIWNHYKQRLGELSRMAAGEQMSLLRSKALKAVMNLSSVCRSALRDENPQAVPPTVDPVTRADADRRPRVTAIYHQAILSYVPKPYAGRVSVLWPSELALDDPDDSSEGWSRVAAEVETHLIPGGHITCVTQYVRNLAEVMRACLEKAQAMDARR